MKYWINSNSGDYMSEKDGKYHLYLIGRWVDNFYLFSEKIELNQSQFDSIKGFIPIKEKKLFSRSNTLKKYAPTLSDGTKGKSTRVEVPTVQDSREQRLKELGL